MSRKQRQFYNTPTDAFKAIENKTVADLRREYTELRAIAVKRLAREKEAHGQTQFYRDYVNMFPYTREIGMGDIKYLAESLADVSRFLQNQESTLSGFKQVQKREANQSRLTIGGMTPLEYRKFREYMKDVRNTKGLQGNYSKFKRGFRALLDKARMGKIDLNQVMQDFKEHKITIGPSGGIYDSDTQQRINSQWSKMG